MKNIFYTILAIAIFSLNSCKEEVGEGTLMMKYEAKVNNSNLEFNKHYVINGDSVYFTMLKFYVSDVTIEDKDGLAEIAVKDVALIDFSELSSTTFSYALEAASYKNPSFIVGLSDETNGTEPSSYPSSSSLSLGTSMYWMMANSYIYFKIEGFRTLNGADSPLVYHVGFDGLGASTGVQKGFTIHKGNTTTVLSSLDINAMFATIDFATEAETHTTNNMPLAQKMMNNLVGALDVQ